MPPVSAKYRPLRVDLAADVPFGVRFQTAANAVRDRRYRARRSTAGYRRIEFDAVVVFQAGRHR